MKTRLGFVSNSSSSSFCILGAKFWREELEKVLSLEDPDNAYANYEYVKKLANKHGLEFASGLEKWGDDSYFIGLTPYQLNEDISINENRKIIKNKLEEVGLHVDEIDWYVDAGYS